MNQDGTVDASDALYILRWSYGLISTLPVSPAAPGSLPVELTVGSATTQPASSFDVTITLAAPNPGVGAYEIEGTYDSSLLTVTDCMSDLRESVCNPHFGSGTIRLAFARANGLTGTVTVARITFETGPTQGMSDLHVRAVVLADANGSDVTSGVTIHDATVTIGEIGDANCDGQVNAIDAALVLQYSAGLVPTLACMENADVNGDGSVDSIDAALILQYSAGLIDLRGPPTPTPSPMPTPTPARIAPPGVLTCGWVTDNSVSCSGPSGTLDCTRGGGFFDCSVTGVSIRCEAYVDLQGTYYLECYHPKTTSTVVDFTCDGWQGSGSFTMVCRQ